MTAPDLSRFDVCACGDYRHQHQAGDGPCRVCGTDVFKPCPKFRLFYRASVIPEGERAVDRQSRKEPANGSK